MYFAIVVDEHLINEYEGNVSLVSDSIPRRCEWLIVEIRWEHRWELMFGTLCFCDIACVG